MKISHNSTNTDRSNFSVLGQWPANSNCFLTLTQQAHLHPLRSVRVSVSISLSLSISQILSSGADNSLVFQVCHQNPKPWFIREISTRVPALVLWKVLVFRVLFFLCIQNCWNFQYLLIILSKFYYWVFAESNLKM